MKDLIVSTQISIKDAFKKLSKVGQKCLIIGDENNRLLGTLTDGDLRNGILKGLTISSSINSIYQTNPYYIIVNEYDIEEVKKIFIDNRYDLIPVITREKEIVDVIEWDQIFGKNFKIKSDSLNASVVVMAGGQGSRLEPFTQVLPKPLVPINDKPIIEHIIENFTSLGCNNFFITVNYKSKIMKAYFEELNPNYNVSFIKEETPLGTAGSLGLLNKTFKQSFFVTNCDIIIKCDYRALYDFHLRNDYDITLVASTKEYVIPYGTCVLNDEGHLDFINEKPKYDFLINTGLYILKPEIIELIPERKFYHITHLIEDAKIQGKKIGVFPIDDDNWIDVGQWAEYRKAIEHF